MNDGDSLRRAIQQTPGDLTLWLAHADWWQENGQEERACWIRRQVEYAKTTGATDRELLDDGRIRCRVAIHGFFQGEPFLYADRPDSPGSQFIYPPDEEGNIDCSDYWWSEGNMSCDCNRACLVFGHPKLGCGHRIAIRWIAPIDSSLPTLRLDEHE